MNSFAPDPLLHPRLLENLNPEQLKAVTLPRVLIGIIEESRVSISLAALLVNVTANNPAGLTWPVWIK